MAINTAMSESYIYIIGADAPPYKVGISKHPERRVKQFQTGYPFTLRLHYKQATNVDKVVHLEKLIHRNITNYQTKGEWFNMPLDKLIGQIEFALIRYEDDPMLNVLAKDKILYNRFI